MIIHSLISAYKLFLDWLLFKGIMIELSILFLFLLILFFINFKELKKHFSFISKRAILFIFIIILFHFIYMMFFMPHHHMMWIDEFEYISSARSYVEKGVSAFCHEDIISGNIICSNLKPSHGWSFFISILFRFFGNTVSNIFIMNILFSCFNIFLLYLLVKIVLKSELTALLSSLFYSILPINLIWATKAESHIIGLFFLLLSLLFFFLFFKHRKQYLAWIAFLSFLFLIQTRIEMIVLLPILIIFYFYKFKKYFLDLKYSNPLLIFSVLFLVFYIPQFNLLRKLGENSNGYRLSIFFSNFINFFNYYILGNFTLFSLFLIFFGIIIALINKKLKVTFFLTTFFLISTYIYVSRSSYVHQRYFVVIFWILGVFLSYSLSFLFNKILMLKNIYLKYFYLFISAILLFMIIFTQFNLLYNNLDYWEIRGDTYYYQQLGSDVPSLVKYDLPLNSYVTGFYGDLITLYAYGISNIIFIDELIYSYPNLINDTVSKYDEIYFYRGLNLNSNWDFYNDNQKFFEDVKSTFNLVPFKEYNLNNITYSLYKIEGVK
jgi:hypothetical protein